MENSEARRRERQQKGATLTTLSDTDVTGPPVRYPQGSDDCCNLAATAEPP
eukprot:COSAG01_NODE_433_length_17113_cov_23.009757_11_plen_51_part_00